MQEMKIYKMYQYFLDNNIPCIDDKFIDTCSLYPLLKDKEEINYGKLFCVTFPADDPKLIKIISLYIA